LTLNKNLIPTESKWLYDKKFRKPKPFRNPRRKPKGLKKTEKG